MTRDTSHAHLFSGAPKCRCDRELNRKYADAHGLFWEPCPICHEHFGGHECGYNSLYHDKYMGSGVCVCYKPECSEKAEAENLKKRQIYGDIEFFLLNPQENRG